MAKKILYISTNGSWSGSEELWTRSAKTIAASGYAVVILTKYRHQELDRLNLRHLVFAERKSIIQKIKDRILKKNADHYFLRRILKNEKPDLVVLSQGNNIDTDGIMVTCGSLNIPYVTITNLVTEYHFLSITADNFKTLQGGYINALQNYFVSHKNLELNNLMLALNSTNSSVIYCPCVIGPEDRLPDYPDFAGYYKIALVGRIECFHKGYDLLLQLAGMPKWKERPIHFNVYGDGPHKELLEENIKLSGLDNITLKGYGKSLQVWKDNHLLFMPSRMEGVALTLIEAMYCRRAAVVTDVGDAARLITNGKNGFVAGTATLSSLDETLEQAWINRDVWQDLGVRAAATLETEYSSDAVGYFNSEILKLI